MNGNQIFYLYMGIHIDITNRIYTKEVPAFFLHNNTQIAPCFGQFNRESFVRFFSSTCYILELFIICFAWVPIHESTVKVI